MIDWNQDLRRAFPQRMINRLIFRSGVVCTGIGFWATLIAALCWSGETIGAQPPTEPATAATAEETPATPHKKPSPVKLLDSLLPDVIYLLNSEKVLVPVPWDATLADFLKFLRQRHLKPAVKLPPAVTKLTLTGTVDDVRAVLVAEFVIQNMNDDEYVSLPLALHEAVLREDVVYDGPGMLFPKEPDRTQGQSWWLRGSGKHHVTLRLSVPVKKQGTNRRLLLTLPFATQSSLELTANFPKVTVKEAEGDADVVEVDGQPAKIKKIGLGTRLDLTWQPVVAESPLTPVLKADTTILAHAAQDELFVEAQQRITVVQGSVSEVVVRLPAHTASFNVDGPRDYRGHHETAGDPTRVVVQLNGPTTGQIQLNWTVRLKALDVRKFELDGFQVEQAQKQDGRIGLIPIQGLLMTAANADHAHLLRINAADLSFASPLVKHAYRFFNQPFRMVVGVETDEPMFTVEPRITLGVSAEELTMDGLFSIHVLRGNLSTVEIDWPNWKTDGWELDHQLIEDGAPADGASGRLRLRLPDDRSDRLTVRFKARRTSFRLGENIPLTLPHIASPDGVQTQLVISDAANVSSDLTPIGETAPFVLPSEAVDALTETMPSTTHRSRGYRVMPGEQAFSLRVTRLEQRVQLTSVTSLAFSGAHLRGVQSFQFDVHHERLAQVRLAIPESWRTRPLQFQIEPGRSLPVQWSPGQPEGLMIAQLTLPEPRLGKFTLQALWDVSLTGDVLAGETPVEIPVFQVVDHPLRQVDLQVDAENASKLTVTDAAWKPRPELSGNARWTADGPVTGATIQLDTDGGGSQPFLITGADVRASWDRQGVADCKAAYRITGWVARIGVVLPVDAGPPQVTWNGQALAAPADLISENKPRHYTLRVPSADGDRQNHVLSIRYRLPASQTFGVWNRWTVVAPQLIQGQWMAEGNWLLNVPGDQHLFGYSSTVMPRFSWQRTGVFWSRISRAEEVLRRGTPASLAVTEPGGNLYAFSQYGEIREFRYSTMSAPLVLLIGASVSLAVGFLMLNVSWLRHMLTVWCGLFLMALAGLWFRPQLEVLLQPILIGCLFPLLAVWIQSLRRRDVPPVLSFDPLMDLVESRSSVSRLPYPGDDVRQEPVLVRSPTGSTHDFLQVEARSGQP